MGNVASASALVDGHSAYPIHACCHTLALYLKKELDPHRLLTYLHILESSEHNSLLEAASSALHLNRGGLDAKASRQAPFESVLLEALTQFELAGMDGYLPASVIRNCLVSGRDIRGIKPGMADAILTVAPVTRRVISQTDANALLIFGQLVGCECEHTLPYRQLLPCLYPPLHYLFFWAALSRYATHKMESTEKKQRIAWPELVVSGHPPSPRRMLPGIRAAKQQPLSEGV